MGKLRFHLLGLANMETHKRNSSVAFIQKIVNLARILKSYGYTVFFYGVEGSEVPCDTFFPVSTQEVLRNTYGDFNRNTSLITYNLSILHISFLIKTPFKLLWKTSWMRISCCVPWDYVRNPLLMQLIF